MCVIIPSLLAIAYYGHFASDRYISESRYIIEGNKQASTDLLGVVSGLTGVSASSSDSLIVMSYAISHDFVEKINSRLDLTEAYSDTRYDWLSRLGALPTDEELLKYWDDEIISILFDSSSGISTLTVTAFTPETAKKISEHILKFSDDFINDLSLESKADALKLAQDEVTKAETALLVLRAKITDLNEEEKVISAEQSAASEQGIVAVLKQKLATTEAEYKKLSSFMQPNSLKLRSMNNVINSLKRQIIAQQETWSDTSASGKTVTSIVLDSGRLESELEFAEKVYINAIISLKQAQIETTQKQRYLDVIVPPHLPDEALVPDRIYAAFTVFLASLMIWGIISLILTSIKDHFGWT